MSQRRRRNAFDVEKGKSDRKISGTSRPTSKQSAWVSTIF